YFGFGVSVVYSVPLESIFEYYTILFFFVSADTSSPCFIFLLPPSLFVVVGPYTAVYVTFCLYLIYIRILGPLFILHHSRRRSSLSLFCSTFRFRYRFSLRAFLLILSIILILVFPLIFNLFSSSFIPSLPMAY